MLAHAEDRGDECERNADAPKQTSRRASPKEPRGTTARLPRHIFLTSVPVPRVFPVQLGEEASQMAVSACHAVPDAVALPSCMAASLGRRYDHLLGVRNPGGHHAPRRSPDPTQ